MNADNPWSLLSVPTEKGMLSARRTNAAEPWNFFWATDSAHNYLFVMRQSTEALGPHRSVPQLKGIHIHIEPDPHSEESTLVFRLLDEKQRDLFFHLCSDLISSASAATNEKAAVSSVLNRTWRWHHLLRGGSGSRLSSEEQRGLIGELLVLERFLLPNFSASDALTAWRGPFGSPKDFEIGLFCIESKARRGAATPFVLISSEFQLDTEGLSRLFLYVADISPAPTPMTNRFSLVDVVNRIKDRVTASDPVALDAYEAALSASGFRWEDDYSGSHWVEGETRLFQVENGFPRITSSSLGSGVSNVRYSVSLAACQSYLVEPALLKEILAGGPTDDHP
jgi:hypothetical protein